MSGVELVLAFLAGVVMGGALDRFVLPLLVDAWIDRLRRHGRSPGILLPLLGAILALPGLEASAVWRGVR